MTNNEAVKTLLTSLYKNRANGHIVVDEENSDDFLYAIGMAISVLMKQEEEKGKHVQRDVPPFEENGGIIYTEH